MAIDAYITADRIGIRGSVWDSDWKKGKKSWVVLFWNIFPKLVCEWNITDVK